MTVNSSCLAHLDEVMVANMKFRCDVFGIRPKILKFSEMLNILPSWIMKCHNWHILMDLLSQNCIFNIFGHKTLTFKFQVCTNVRHCPSKKFSLLKVHAVCTLMGLKIHFHPYLVRLWLWPLTFNFPNLMNLSSHQSPSFLKMWHLFQKILC